MIEKIKLSGHIDLFLISIIFAVCILNLGNNGAFAQQTDSNSETSIRFFNVNMPATPTVGKDFTLNGMIVVDSVQTLDHVYLTIQGSGQLWIYGDQTVDLGYFVGGSTQKHFSFKIRPLQSGNLQITLSAVGIQNNMGVQLKGSTSINSSAVSTLNATQTSSQLAFTNIGIPSDIVSGHETIITYLLVNKGSVVANDVIITLTPPSGILVKGDAVNNVGKILPGQSVSSSFKVVTTGSGSFTLNLVAFSSNSISSTLPITITVAESSASLAVTSITTSPAYIYPGDFSSAINVGITNFGQEDLRGVILHPILPDGIKFTSTGDNSYIFSYLPSAKNFPYNAQQIATFHINIDKNIPPGTQILGLSFSHTSLSNYTIPLPITINPKAQFELQNVTYSASTLVGTQTESSLSTGISTVLRATIKNVGTAPAESVVGSLQVSNDFQGIRTTGVTNVGVLDRVGQILPNQIFHVTFTLDVDPTTNAGTYPGTISFSWQQEQVTDSFSQSVPLFISVATTPIFNSLPYLQIFLGGTSALFLLLYLLARRKKTPKEGDRKVPI